jgi:hypothetical protein
MRKPRKPRKLRVRTKLSSGTRSLPVRLAQLGYSSYQEYLASNHWAELRRRFYASKLSSRTVEGEHCCRACLRDDVWLSVHHLTYKRIGRERLKDLMLVCDPCHKSIHRSGHKGSLWSQSNRVVRVKRGGLMAHRDNQDLPF